MIKITAIGGSVRPDSLTSRALELVADWLRAQEGVAVDLVDVGALDLRLPGLPGGEADAAQLQERVGDATGVVLATPEYHGSFSSGMKLVIDNLGFPSALAGKPVALLGVAAGKIGAIKALEHLRSVCSHVGAIVLPGPVSIANVGRAIDDEATQDQIRNVGRTLLDYIHSSVCPRVALEEAVRHA